MFNSMAWILGSLCLVMLAVVGVAPEAPGVVRNLRRLLAVDFFTVDFFTLAPSRSFKLPDNEIRDTPSDRYELSPACTTLLRSQVNMEMHASLVYMSMAAYFGQNGVARKGFEKLFDENSKEEREHARMFIDYLNVRGGKFTDFNIDMPDKTSWTNALEAINDAIVLEKEVYNQLNHIHDIAGIHCKDQHLMDYLEKEFFTEQVESIDSFIRHSSILGGMADDHALAEYLYDKQLQETKH